MLKEKLEEATAEHVMLVVLLVLGAVFFTEPIVVGYPDDARVFPQMMATVVIVGSVLLLFRSYLPGPLQTFVAENVSLSQDLEEEEMEEVEEVTEEDLEGGEGEAMVEKGDPLHVAWGYDLNNTVVMMVFASLYFFLGYAAGFLYITPIFVFLYTTWFRVKWYYGVMLALLATAVVYGFVEFLIMPFDRGEIIFTDGLI